MVMSLSAVEASIKPRGLQMLDEVVADSVTKDDLKEIVGKFLEKAKSGHVPSANFLLKLMGAEAHAPQTMIVNNNSVDSTALSAIDNRTPHARAAEDRVATFLQVNGPALLMDICIGTGYADEAVTEILKSNPSSFVRQRDKWTLNRG